MLREATIMTSPAPIEPYDRPVYVPQQIQTPIPAAPAAFPAVILPAAVQPAGQPVEQVVTVRLANGEVVPAYLQTPAPAPFLAHQQQPVVIERGSAWPAPSRRAVDAVLWAGAFTLGSWGLSIFVAAVAALLHDIVVLAAVGAAVYVAAPSARNLITRRGSGVSGSTTVMPGATVNNTTVVNIGSAEGRKSRARVKAKNITIRAGR
ncbi:hypothetical protein ACGF07_31800 [Kitasatospora sp. NPDC048194]|uniref:hypothetical protein n=1 Tax=Kitasatospora sp. NPDC048194 TaxID=3364045 RepID=UPI00371053A8